MPYPRLSYCFSFILQLIMYFYSPISDFCILCELQAERVVFGSIMEQRIEVHKTGWNVATSQHRDVGSTIIEVNKRQRRNVSTSRHLNVVTSARFFVSPSLKAKGDQNSKASRYVRTRAWKSRHSEPDQQSRQLLLYCFSSFLKDYECFIN